LSIGRRSKPRRRFWKFKILNQFNAILPVCARVSNPRPKAKVRTGIVFQCLFLVTRQPIWHCAF
jgi:hypothetical protein